MNILNAFNENKQNIINENNIEDNYVLEWMNFNNNINKELCDGKKILYKSLVENTNTVVLNESFNDFMQNIRKIIDKIIKFIRDLFNKFTKKIREIIKNIKTKRRKSAFKGDPTNYKGYNYIIYGQYPMINSGKDSVELTLKDVQTILCGLPRFEDQRDTLTSYFQKLDNTIANYYEDRTRQYSINYETKIAAEDFEEILWKLFRDGGIEITIDLTNKDTIEKYKREFEDYKEIEETINNDRLKMEMTYKDLEKSIETFTNKISDGLAGAPDILNIYHSITAILTKMININTSVYLQVYTNKLKAAKEYLEQLNDIIN